MYILIVSIAVLASLLPEIVIFKYFMAILAAILDLDNCAIL